MQQHNIKLVQEIYAAVGRGDISAVVDRMTDDIEIEVPGPAEIPFAGDFHGADGVGLFFQAIGANADVHVLEPREFIADTERVVVLGHEKLTAKRTGRTWETDWAMVWTTRDGKVSRLREYHQTDAIAAAFR